MAWAWLRRNRERVLSKRREKLSRQVTLESFEPRHLMAIAAIPNQPLPVAAQPIAIESGLIDNDPAIDLVTLSSSGVLSVALNATNRTWRNVRDYDYRLGTAYGMAAGVLDSNAGLDLVVVGSNTARVLYGDGNGGFTQGATLQSPTNGRFRPSDSGRAGAAIGLVNNDTFSDIVLLDTLNHQVIVWFGGSNRSFSSPVTYATGGVDPTSVAVADLIGDAQPDIVIGHRDGSITFLEGMGNATFELKPTATVRGGTPVRSLTTGDLDADGDIDIAVAAQSQAYVLLRDASPLPGSPIVNSSFANGLTGWQFDSIGQTPEQTAGAASALGGVLQLRENSSLLTSLAQTFTVPPNPQTISIDILSLGLEPAIDGTIPDAFELSLLTENGSSLVPTHRPAATSFFNTTISSNGVVNARMAPGVQWDGRRVTLDISQLASGTEAKLVLDLVGNPPGALSTVQIDTVSISPAAIYSRSFTRVALNSPDSVPLNNAVDVAIGEVDSDDRTDIVVADAGGRLFIFNGGEQPGSFDGSFISSSTLGGNPLAISLDRFQAASFVTNIPLDAAVVLDSSARVVTTLGADTTPPQAIFLSPATGERLSAISEVRVQFSEPIIRLGTSDEHSVTNLNAWSLYEFGPNGVDDRGAGDDRRLPLTGVNYDAGTRTATVGIAAAARPLVEGRYGLLVRGQDTRYAIQDLFGNHLNGGSDASGSFAIDRRPSLGAIETSPNQITEGQPVTLRVPLSDGVLGGPYDIAINWGDGTVVTNRQLVQPGLLTVEHIYATRGNYTVRVIATDAFDQKISVSRTVNVIEDKGLQLPKIDFERDADSQIILAPALLIDQYAKYGIQVTATEDDDDHHDDDDHDDDVQPTIVNWARDIDRSTPGGTVAGNVLVIAEQDDDDHHDDDDDYRPHDDDIEIEAGTLTFLFQTPVMLDDVKLLGIKHANYSKIQAFSATGQRLISKQVWGNWTGAEQTVALNAIKVAKLTIQFSGRGAVSELVFNRSGNNQVASSFDFLPGNPNDKAVGGGSVLPSSPSNLGGGIAIGQVVSSNLAAEQTVDWTFNATAGQKIYVNFQALEGELQSELLDPTGKLLATAFSSRASAHDSGSLALEDTGRYTLRLSSTIASIYQFQIFDVPAADVNPLVLGQIQTGALNSPGRPDHWTLTGVSGTRYYLDFLTLDTVVGGDLVVEVTLPSGQIISERTSTRVNGLDQMFTLTDIGTATIVMRAVFDGSHLPAYSFRLTQIPPDDVRPLAFRQVATGQIEAPGARDVWTISGSAGQRVFFDMQSISPADVRVQILKPDRSLLSERILSLASGLDVELLLPTSGQYTIVIDAAGSAELISYQFQLWDIPADVVRSGLINATLSGVTVPGEVARYEFEATAGTPVLLDIIQSSNLALGVTLIAPDGQTIIERATSDVLLSLPTTGTYQALVGRSSQFFLDGAGPYAFRIQDRSSPTIGGPDNLGTRFYVAFPPNLRQPFGANNPAFSLTIAAPRGTSGTVQIPGIGYYTSFAVAAGQSTRIELPSGVELSDSDVIVDKGVLVTALDEVAVYGLDQMQESTDGFTALPTDVIGRDYYVLGYANTIDYVVGGGTSLTLAAAADDTRVTMTQTVAVGARAAGVPFTITLNAGQAYTLHTSLPFLADLSGTRVTSTKPVSLFGGNTASRVPVGFASADHLIEQMPPTETWGSRFLTEPLATRIGGDTFRFLAQRDNTQVRINGELAATLDAGEFLERILPQASLVEATEPILVAQYANSTQFDGVISDPFMMLIPPVEQYLNDYTLSTPSTGIDSNFANLIVPTRSVGSVTLDGVAVAVDQFQPIGSSGYSGAQIPISIGSHRFRANEPLGVSIYGFADFDSYGYFGGMSLSRIALAERLTLSPLTATVPIGTTHFVTAAVFDTSGNPVRGVRVDFLISDSSVGATSESRFAYTGTDGRASIDLRRTSSSTVNVSAQVGLLTALATVTWQAAAPTLEVTSPLPNSQLPVGQQLISGIARPGTPGAAIVEVTLDGRRVEALDTAGNFFAPVDIRVGSQVFTLTAIDSQGVQVSTTLTVVGVATSASKFDVSTSSDITTTSHLVFANTTFNRQFNRLAVQVQLANAGQQPIDRNVALRFDSIEPSRVIVANPDDVTAGSSLTRKPLMVFDTELPAAGLVPNEKSAAIEVQFTNSERDRFAISTSLLGNRNRTPLFSSVPDFQATLGKGYRYAAQATDPDGSRLTYSLLVAPTGMVVSATTGVVAWTPRVNQAGANQVALQVSDGRGGVAVQRFTIVAQATPANRPPLFVTAPATQVTPGAGYRYAARATDPDGDVLSYSLLSSPSGMSIVSSTGVITYPSSVAGSYTVEVQVSDGRGGLATQRYQLRVGAGTAISSPSILSRPPVIGQVDNLYVYSVNAVDPRQSALTYSLATAPTGMTIDTATGRVTWTPTAAQTGVHNVRIEVRNVAGGYASQFYSLDIQTVRPNATPQFTSEPLLLATLGAVYQYRAIASDPEGQAVRYALSRAPLGMTIDSSSGVISWTPASGQLGSQGVIVVATDPVTGASAGRAVQQFTVTVRGANTAPVFTSTPILQAAVGSIYRYDATATDTEDEVTYSFVSAPNGMLIDPRSGAITFAPGVSSIGSRVVTVRASDARGLSVDQRYTLAISDDTTPPSVTIVFSQNTINVGESVRIRVVASDGSGVQSVQLTIDGQPVTLDGLRSVTWQSTRPGIPNIEATARDTRGNVTTQRANPPLRVLDPSDTTDPEILITSPAPSSVLTYLTDIIGTVRDENLELYRLEVSLSGKDEWRTISTRTFPAAPGLDGVVNDLLGVFDPTLLANDLYDLRIVAQDFSGNQSFLQVGVGVEGGAKLGNFTISFTDLAIPVAGLPITIGRTYDTLNAPYSSDFGYGWRLDIGSPNIRESVRISDSENAGAGSLVANPFRDGTRVYLNSPDGKRVGFTFTPEVQGGLLGAIWTPKFTADPGVDFELEVESTSLTQNSDGTYELYLFGLPYNPDTYTLVSKSQVRYTYNQFSKLQLQKIEERNNVTLTVDATGIHSSIGPEILWTRDALGRITRITDVAGNHLDYAYSDSGDLSSFTNQINDTTRMTYRQEPSHYLASVIDPRGTTVLRLDYDANGRLSGQGDAFGNTTHQEYDLANNREVVADRLGNETTLIFDNRGNITSATNALGETTRFEFDDEDRETKITTSLGNATTFTYDTRDNVTSQTNARGATWKTTYDVLNNPLKQSKPSGIANEFTYDMKGNLTIATDGNGSITNLELDSIGRVIAQVNAVNQRTTYFYSPTEIPTKVFFADGSFRQLTYNQFQQPTRMVDERGFVTTIEYDATGNPVKLTDAGGKVYRYQYDQGRLTKIEYPTGDVRQYIYDAMGNRITEVEPDGGVWSYTFDANGNKLSETSPLGRVTRWEYDEIGRKVREIDPAGKSSLWEYDADGNEIANVDRLGRRTTFQYDQAGNRTAIVNPDGSVFRMEYDLDGMQISTTDESLVTTRYTRDGRGRVTHTIDTLGGVVQRQYDPIGNVIGESDAAGRLTQYVYNNRNFRTATIAPDGGRTTFLFDVAGNPISVTDPMRKTWATEFDPMNRPVRTTDPLGGVTRTTYDGLGRLASVTDPLGRSQFFTSDINDRPLSHTDERNLTESWTWDKDGNLTTVTDFVGNKTRYVYNANNQVARESDPLNRTRVFEYDAEENLIEAIDANGKRRTFEYNFRDQLTKEHWWSGNTEVNMLTFGFDPTGDMLSAQDNSNRWIYARDDLGRIVSSSQQFSNGATFQLTYDLDAAGLVRQATDQLGVTVTSTFDAAGRVSTRDWTGLPTSASASVRMTYDAAGKLRDVARFAFGSNRSSVTTTRSFDEKGRLASISHKDATDAVLAQYDFTRDLDDQIVAILHHNRTDRFAFDAASQLLSETRNGANQWSTEYDERGNRTGLDQTTDSANQLLSDDRFSYSYDYEGNLTQRVERATGRQFDYVYDHRNRLIQVMRSVGGVVNYRVQFEYDALDHRVGKRTDPDGVGPLAAQVERYALDGDHVWADLNGSGAVQTRYLFGEGTDQLLARWRSVDGLVWYLTDQLGSVRDLTDAAGQLIDSIDYDAFGNIVSESDPNAGGRFKYTGREWEAEIELYYYRARYYSPATGRFINRDPIGFEGGDGNLYRYVANNPLTFTDPTGNTTTAESGATTSRTVLPLTKGYSCAAKAAGEALPEFLLTGDTMRLAEMGAEVVSCAVSPAAAASNKFYATLVVRLKGGQMLSGEAAFRSSKIGGLSRYCVEAFYDCATVTGAPGDYRSANENPTGKEVHHLGAKGHKLHTRVREILAECCIGVNSALNTVPLEVDDHRKQGLHRHKNLNNVKSVLRSAFRKGCEFVAGSLRRMASDKGKVNL